MSKIIIGEDGKARCKWSNADALYIDYHDNEWGMPTKHDFILFEKLCLEGFQSGLSWRTILGKPENFRKAFENFDFTNLMTQKLPNYCKMQELCAIGVKLKLQ